jgi:hypothetical protein
MKKLLLQAVVLFCIVPALQAQIKLLPAIKVTDPPKIDGVLDESLWKNLPEATGFITNSPVFGQPASTTTTVKLCYDNTAIYIGAFIYEDPAKIRKQFTVRDNMGIADVDYFAVFIDTYKDRQNAYQFQVTTRNVQTDSRLSPNTDNGFGVFGDLGWDAVWDSKVAMQTNGWSVEMKIPYFTLRFVRAPIQDWGINFLLFSRRNNEQSFWSPVNPNENGFVNQFGDLTGLTDMKPPLRLSFSPYVSGGYSSVPEAGGKSTNEWLKSGGMDIKYGLSESFTLDATLIPDFGQVVSDNVINNITPFEQQFRENRPFFTEGTELFNKAGTFYTRRIGRQPSGYFNVKDLGIDRSSAYEVKKNPAITRLYNALKFSGRTKNTLGVGLFNAIAQPVKAIVRNKNTGTDSTIITEELTNYNVFVLDQALKNRSYITFTNTSTLRNGNARDATVTSLDVALFDKKNKYSVTVRPRYSNVISKKRYDGFSNELIIGKVSGTWQWNVKNILRSPNYDPTDLGFLRFTNQFINLGEISYNIFKQSRRFLNQRYAFRMEQSYLYKPTLYQKTEFVGSARFVFKNFWDMGIEMPVALWYNDYFWYNTFYDRNSRGRNLKRSPYISIFVNGSTDSRKKWFVGWDLGFAEGPLPSDPYYAININTRYRFSDRVTINWDFGRQQDKGQWGWAQSSNGFITDANNEPVLARRKYTEVSNIVSGTYNFTSRMSLTFRTRHYWNRLLNRNFYFPQVDGYWKERFDYNPSEFNANINFFNLDMFYTWDFKLGSRLVVAYKNALGNDFVNTLPSFSNKGYLTNAYKSSFVQPHFNELTVRFIYFLNYEDIRKRPVLR